MIRLSQIKRRTLTASFMGNKQGNDLWSNFFPKNEFRLHLNNSINNTLYVHA